MPGQRNVCSKDDVENPVVVADRIAPVLVGFSMTSSGSLCMSHPRIDLIVFNCGSVDLYRRLSRQCLRAPWRSNNNTHQPSPPPPSFPLLPQGAGTSSLQIPAIPKCEPD